MCPRTRFRGAYALSARTTGRLAVVGRRRALRRPFCRQRDKLREELTLAQIDRHTEGIAYGGNRSEREQQP